MALIGLFCGPDDARRELSLALEEMGHRVAPAIQLREAMEVLAELRPRLMVVAAATEDRSAECFLGEVGRVSPLMPVVAALPRRDAVRAVELMKAGAFEVISPPWTRENLSACVLKALRFDGTTFELTRPSDRARSAAAYFTVVAAFFALALGVAALRRHRRAAEEARRPVVSEWELPYAHPSGMAYDGKQLWVADWYARVLYRHDPGTMVLRASAAFPAATPVALAFTAEALWVVASDGTLTRHLLDEGLTQISSHREAFPGTVGIAYDGLYLWTLDGRRKKFRKHLPDERLTVIGLYDAPGSKPVALAFDGRALWTLDSGNRELLRHDLGDPRIVTRRIPLREYRGGRWRATGLAWDGRALRSVAESADPKRNPGRSFLHALEPEGGGAGEG